MEKDKDKSAVKVKPTKGDDSTEEQKPKRPPRKVDPKAINAPTPYLHEMKTRLENKPLSKGEIVDYLLKLQQMEGVEFEKILDPRRYRQFSASPEISELIKEVNMLRELKYKCNDIIS